MREGKILPNWKYLVQRISQSGSQENIDLKDTWFTPDLEEDPRKPPSQELSVAPENNNKTITSPRSKTHAQESPDSKGSPIYEVIECTASKGVRNTSNKKKFVPLNNNPTRPVGYHLAREKKNFKSTTKD